MEDYIIIKEDNFEKARKKIQENKEKKIIFNSENDELNRKILEKEPINILLLNQAHKKDRLKQRESGFNHVLAKIAKKKNITIGINLDEIIEFNSKQKAKIMGRIIQNIKICNRNNVNMKFIQIKDKNQRKSQDLKSLGLVLGMNTKMTKNI